MSLRGRGPASVVAVVLHFRDADDTVRCVESLRRSGDLDLAVLVVDNGPADDDHAALAQRLGPRVGLVATGENLGYAGGNNVGIRLALEDSPEHVWVLNPDTVVHPGTLGALRSTASAVGDAGIVGPRLLLGDDDPPRIWSDGGVVDGARWGATSNVNAGRPVPADDAPGVRDVGYVGGASMLLRASMLRDVGLLPEEWFLYFEETDYCRTVRRAGWRTVVDTRAVMTHHKRSSGLLPTPYYLYYMTRNRLHFAERHFAGHRDEALADFRRAFLDPWRTKVDEHAPDWLPRFDRLVDLAIDDADRGTWGRRAEIDDIPAPVARSREGQ